MRLILELSVKSRGNPPEQEGNKHFAFQMQLLENKCYFREAKCIFTRSGGEKQKMEAQMAIKEHNYI